MAQFTVYTANDSGAPTFNGLSGSLTGLLTACLVNGYGAKAAAGWTLAFTSTTGQAVYQQGAANLFYFRVDDSGPGPGGTKEARLDGFETMTSVHAGTNSFPGTAQGAGSSGFLVARKSVTADSTSRYWVVAADNRTVYGFIQSNDVPNVYCAFAFGDIYSLAGSGDGYRTIIIGRQLENTGLGNELFDKVSFLAMSTTTLSSMNIGVSGHFMPRSYTAAGTSINVGKHADAGKTDINSISGLLPYPNPQNNASYISPLWIVEPTNGTIRGRMRGLYCFCHTVQSVNDGATFNGFNNSLYSGKSFMLIKPSVAGGVYVLETSNTLETN